MRDKFFVPKPVGLKFGFSEPKKEKKIQFADINIITERRHISQEQIEEIERENMTVLSNLFLVERPRVTLDRISSQLLTYIMLVM
uniref:Uncharacterized protein n=1 Tax=Fervidobacterium thailandense TaxID=1008305 RepID=A0A7C4VSY2_9BACT